MQVQKKGRAFRLPPSTSSNSKHHCRIRDRALRQVELLSHLSHRISYTTGRRHLLRCRRSHRTTHILHPCATIQLPFRPSSQSLQTRSGLSPNIGAFSPHSMQTSMFRILGRCPSWPSVTSMKRRRAISLSGQGESGVPPNRAPLSWYYFLRFLFSSAIPSAIPHRIRKLMSMIPHTNTNSMS